MWKKWTALLLGLMCFTAPALAEVFEGSTVARVTETVLAQTGGVVEAVAAEVGMRVEAGDTLFQISSERTFASQDGTVSMVSAREGDKVSGSVLEIAPVERYTIHCTVDKAYQSAASTLVHSGETVYIKCTADGTHRATGIVNRIDGEEYRVLTLGGELYVGETVYLYRDADFTTTQRVGIGTVVVSDTQAYEAEGVLSLLRVKAGDAVERGQLLYAIGGGEIASTGAGIVTEISCGVGESISEGQIVARIVPEDAVGVEIEVDQTRISRIAVGDSASLVFAGKEEETAVSGTVVEIRDSDESGTYIVTIQPATTVALPLGMSVEVRI